MIDLPAGKVEGGWLIVDWLVGVALRVVVVVVVVVAEPSDVALPGAPASKPASQQGKGKSGKVQLYSSVTVTVTVLTVLFLVPYQEYV